MKEVDVRGLSCPEPLLIVTGELNSKEGLRILISEAHTKKNIENLLKSKNIDFTEKVEGNDYILETK